jgi:hypothetical protein
LPAFSAADAACVQNFYLSLRSSSCGGISGSLPITARQLESLVRLAEARARVELRETVTADDAQVRSLLRKLMGLCRSLGLRSSFHSATNNALPTVIEEHDMGL